MDDDRMQNKRMSAVVYYWWAAHDRHDWVSGWHRTGRSRKGFRNNFR